MVSVDQVSESATAFKRLVAAIVFYKGVNVNNAVS